jgi:hypothetical protein
MGKAKTQKRKISEQDKTARKQAKSRRLVINLDAHALRRLRILSEESTVNTVLNEAVMLLWEHHYPPVVTAPLEATEVNPIVQNKGIDNDTLDRDKCKKAQTFHARGMYIEDIAAELDWSCEKVQSALTQTELTTPPAPAADTETLKTQIKALRDRGMSLSAIAKKLNKDSVPTVSGSGKWHHGAVKRLLG